MITSTIFVLVVGLALLLGKAGNGRASNSLTYQSYFPVLTRSTHDVPIPSLVASIQLEGARCPVDMTFNKFSGDLYIANEETDNVSIIRNKTFVTNIYTGNKPNHVESDPKSDRVYVSNLFTGITILNDDKVTNHIPAYGEAFHITSNEVNGYTYVTDLHRPVTVIRGSEKVKDLFMPDFFNGKVFLTIFWQLTSEYDRLTGLTYFPSWQNGIMTVIDGTEVVDQFLYHGEGGVNIVIDSYRHVMVVANIRAREGSKQRNNISVVDLNTKEVTQIYSAKISGHAELDPTSGYIYVTNPSDNNVTVLQGKEVIGTYPSGQGPSDVAVDSITRYAYITNRDDNSVSIFKDGIPVATIDLPADKGFDPKEVTIDEENGRIYILSRSTVKEDSSQATQAVQCKQPWVHVLEY